MKIRKIDIKKRMQHFETACHNEGIKLTHQRIEIFREVVQSGDHPDAEQVFKRVRTRIPTVSLDTVYRTLWLLNDLGLVSTLGSSRERARFDANLNRHHHFVCGQCGNICDFYCDDLDNINFPESVRSLGELRTIHMELRGTCYKCLKKAEHGAK